MDRSRTALSPSSECPKLRVDPPLRPHQALPNFEVKSGDDGRLLAKRLR